MNYPTNLPLSAVSLNLGDGAFSPLYDIVWSVKYEIKNWSQDSEYGLCLFLRDFLSLDSGGKGIDLGYSGDIQDTVASQNGMDGGKLGIGLDTHGVFAAEVTWPTGKLRTGIEAPAKNSVTIRGGSDSDFDFIINKEITQFDLLSDGIKILRARLGNYGNTLYLDYRSESDDDFVNIITKDIDIDFRVNERLTPGVSFALPLTSSSSSMLIDVLAFHVEGKDADPILDPNVITREIEPLLPLQPQSTFSGALPQAPLSEFELRPAPVPNIVMCNPLSAALSVNLTSDPRPFNSGDELVYTATIKNIGATRIENISLVDTSLNFLETIQDELNMFGGSGFLDPDQSVDVIYSYTITQQNINDGFILNKVNVSSAIGTFSDELTTAIVQATPGELSLVLQELTTGPYEQGEGSDNNLIRFKVRAENIGETSLIIDVLETVQSSFIINIVIEPTDDPDNLFITSTELAPGQIAEAEFTYSVQPDDIEIGEITAVVNSGNETSNTIIVTSFE